MADGNVTKLKYNTKCGVNFSQHWAEPKAIIARDQVFREFQGWMAIPATALGIILTLLYIIAVYRSIRDHKVSRKFYSLLMNRALGDMLACFVSLIIIVYTLTATHINADLIQILSTIFVGCFWSAMVSYVSLGFLKLYGIARPLHYRDRITLTRCIHLIILSWIAFAILVSMSVVVSAFTKIDALAQWSGCRTETCLHAMYQVRNSATAFVYFVTVFCFIVTVILIRRARKFAKSFHQPSANKKSASLALRKRFRFPLIKLTLNVLTLAIFHLPYTIWAMVLTVANGCFYPLHYNVLQEVMGFVRLSLLIRITLDTLISFATDQQLRHSLLRALGLESARIFPRGLSANFRSSVSVGEISSESTSNVRRKSAPTTRNAGDMRKTYSNTLSTTVESNVDLLDSRHSNGTVKSQPCTLDVGTVVTQAMSFDKVDLRPNPATANGK